MESRAIPLFREQFLSTRSGFSTVVNSAPVPVEGNRAVLTAMVTNVSAATTLTFAIDGSYDGLTWKELTTVTQNSFGWNTVAQASVDHPTLRARVTIAGTNVDAIFDATLAFSEQ